MAPSAADPERPTGPLRTAPLAESGGQTPATGQPRRCQALERYLKESPADLPAYLELAGIYRRQERPAEAARVLQKALEMDPDDPTLLWEYEEATLARSLQQLQQVRQLAARLQTVEAEQEQERCETNWACRRIDVCRARLRRDPQNQQLRLTLAQTLKDLQEFEEAIEVAGQATADPATAPAAHLIRGQALQALGKRVEALPAYRAAALRRSQPAPAGERVVALRAAIEIADMLGLDLSADRYRRFLQLAEAERTAPRTSAAAPGETVSPTPDAASP